VKAALHSNLSGSYSTFSDPHVSPRQNIVHMQSHAASPVVFLANLFTDTLYCTSLHGPRLVGATNLHLESSLRVDKRTTLTQRSRPECGRRGGHRSARIKKNSKLRIAETWRRGRSRIPPQTTHSTGWSFDKQLVETDECLFARWCVTRPFGRRCRRRSGPQRQRKFVSFVDISGRG